MKYTWCSVLLLAFFSHCSQANEIGSNIDNSLKQCKNSAISTIDSHNCYDVALKEWDSELGNQYKLLMNGQPDHIRIALRDSQRQWIKYRDQYVSAIDVFYKQQGGTISVLIAAESKLNVTRDKAIDLYKLRNSINLSSSAFSDNNPKSNDYVKVKHEDKKNGSTELDNNTSGIKELVCKFVMQGDKSVKELPGFFAENKMTVLDKGTQFTVLTGNYFNIPDKLISPDNLTSANNKLIGTGSRQKDGSVLTFSKDSSNYVVTTWENTSFKHKKFQLILFACK
jgi:uncharacterized protein YecT (DUF1311 family)